MAGAATGTMISVEPEVAVVIEPGRFPAFGSVTASAARLQIAVQGIFGALLTMTAHTLLP